MQRWCSRPDMNPGYFKSKGNRAGATVFVAPELVAGTLKQGYAVLQSLEAPFQRAVFLMFLVAEVHPCADGNGRTARLMMNAELSAAGEQRIIIPTVFRNNYLAALNALSRNGTPEPLIRVLDFAWRWTAARSFNSRIAQMACRRTLSPMRAPWWPPGAPYAVRRRRQFRYLHYRSDSYRLER